MTQRDCISTYTIVFDWPFMAPKDKEPPRRWWPSIHCWVHPACRGSLLNAGTVVSSAVVILVVTRQAWLRIAAETLLMVLFFTVATAWSNDADGGEYTRLLTPDSCPVSRSSHRPLDACIRGMHFGWRPALTIGLVHGAACQLGPLSPQIQTATALALAWFALAALCAIVWLLDVCYECGNPTSTCTDLALYTHQRSLEVLAAMATVGIVAVLAYRS